MDLQLTEEQGWLRESVDDMARREAGDEPAVPPEAAERLWANLTEFGAFELGEGLGAVELALIAETLGRHLAPVPFAESAAVHYALARAGGAIEPVGTTVAACLSEPGRSFAPADPATTFDGGRLTGEKSDAAFAAMAELLAVPAAGPDGVVLALVTRDSPGVATWPESTLDPSLQPARVRLESALTAGESGTSGDAELVSRLAAVAGVLVSAEAAGAAAAVLELARVYATQRRQFGHTIGGFQAIRHLLADMYVKVESSWSSVLYAAASLDEDDDESLRTASIAKAYAARATRDVAHGALQVFGGIAFTAEHPAHRFLRRVVARGAQFGTARDHERALGQSLADRMEVPA
jgi:alkylation response protein AidB-like acyl-CoA dehydrogenase